MKKDFRGPEMKGYLLGSPLKWITIGLRGDWGSWMKPHGWKKTISGSWFMSWCRSTIIGQKGMRVGQ